MSIPRVQTMTSSHTNRTDEQSSREPLVLLGIGIVCLFVSGINPFDRLTWIESFRRWRAR